MEELQGAEQRESGSCARQRRAGGAAVRRRRGAAPRRRRGARQDRGLGRQLHRRPVPRRQVQAAAVCRSWTGWKRPARWPRSAPASPAWRRAIVSPTRWCSAPTPTTRPCRRRASCRCPTHVDFRSGAAVMLQGTTAHYLTHSTFPLNPGDTALVHAGAGGVGQLIIQVARKRGARVIGDGRHRGQGGAGARGRRRARYHLHASGLRSRGQAAHRRTGCRCGVRLRGEGHVRQEPELPAPARRAGAVRILERRRWRRSIRRCSAPRDRCSSPGPASTNTSPRARSWWRAPPTSSPG